MATSEMASAMTAAAAVTGAIHVRGRRVRRARAPARRSGGSPVGAQELGGSRSGRTSRMVAASGVGGGADPFFESVH